AVHLCKVEIDDCVARRARLRPDRVDKRHAVAGNDLGERRIARREAGEVDAEPFGERGIDISDAAFLVGREEAGRCVVEMVDRLLKIEEETLLLGALARDIGKLPRSERLALSRNVEGAGPYPVPARAGLGAWADRLAKPEFAVAGLPVLD